MYSSSPRFRRLIALAIALLIAAVLAPTAGAHGKKHGPGSGSSAGKAVFFAADGMRQDLVAKYAAQGLMPTMQRFLRHGVSATDGGLLTQAPPNTGAGWYSLATGAWPGVHGSTNNTFHINGQPFDKQHVGVHAGRPAGRVDRPVARSATG